MIVQTRIKLFEEIPEIQRGIILTQNYGQRVDNTCVRARVHIWSTSCAILINTGATAVVENSFETAKKFSNQKKLHRKPQLYSLF